MKRMRIMKLVVVVLLLSIGKNMQAQGLGDIFDKLSNATKESGSIVSNLIGGGKLKQAQVIGTWTYAEPAVVLESSSLLNKAGGKLIASKLENQLAEVLEKCGVTAGKMKLTINKDYTYNSVVNERTSSGTYELTDSTIVFYTARKVKAATVHAEATSSALLLTLNADKLLHLVSVLGSSVKTNSTMNAISKVASSYDGMQLGLRCRKEK